MKKIFIFVLLLGGWSCSQEDFKTYTGGNYLSFLTDYRADSIITSFFYYYNSSHIDLPVVVALSGAPLKEDCKFNVSVVKEESDAPDANYDLKLFHVFRKNRIKDTIYIRLLKTDDDILKTKAFRLVIQIDANEIFTPGQVQLRKKKIIFSDLIAKPEWWDDIVVEAYLGNYSNLKYQEFLKATDGEGAFFGEKESAEKRKLALIFKYYLIENPVWDGYIKLTVPIN